jgi:hypothetical protein
MVIELRVDSGMTGMGLIMPRGRGRAGRLRSGARERIASL